MFSINSISFKGTTPINNKKQQPNFMGGYISEDVFVKSKDPIKDENITPKENSDFAKWAKEYELEKNIESILNNEDNILGSGFTHTAYSIPDCDDYILRKFNSNDISNINPDEVKIEEIDDRGLKVNIGQMVGKLELPNSNGEVYSVEVLRKQKGKPIGNPPVAVIYVPETDILKDGEKVYEAKERQDNYIKYIEKLADLPVSSYEKLISDYEQVANAGYFFDHLNSNNLFYDEENQAINFIDMEDSKRKPNYGNLLYALTNIYYFDTYKSPFSERVVSDEETFKAIQNTVTITNKFIEAMRNQGVKFDREEQSMEFCDFLSSMPVTFLCRTTDIDQKWEYLKAQGVA